MRNYAYFTEKKGIGTDTKILTNQDILTIMATKDIDLEFRTIVDLVIAIQIMPCWH
jgi:hypothetical protein